MSTTEKQSPPLACTLTVGELAKQTLAWSDLAPAALTHKRIEGGAATTYPLTMVDQIEELANRESQCCGTWLNVAVTRLDATVRLDLTTANPEGVALIHSMLGDLGDT